MGGDAGGAPAADLGTGFKLMSKKKAEGDSGMDGIFGGLGGAKVRARVCCCLGRVLAAAWMVGLGLGGCCCWAPK